MTRKLTKTDHEPIKTNQATKSQIHITWDPAFLMTTPRKWPSSEGGLTSLMVACQQELDADVGLFISRKPSVVTQKDRSGKSALHYCAENTHTACAEQILDSNPDLIDTQDDEGYSPLHLTVISGNKTMVRFLIERNANVNCVDNEKHSCIHWATVCGELGCLDLLMDANADPSTPDIHGAYPLHYAAQMCGPNSEMGNNIKVGFQVLQKLLERKVDVNCQDQDGRQPLLWAASAETRASKTYCPSGSSDAILKLVKTGADVASHDKDGLTALHCAASRGHLDCLETLITLCGAEVDIPDGNGCSPLFYSVTLGHADCTNLLLGFNAKPNLQDRSGRTAAHCGASKGQFETLRILGQYRANLWLRNIRGDTPLHEAVQSGRKELVEWLLEQMEGSVNVTNVNGRTPLHIAAITNNIEMCKVLMDHGAYINPIMKNSKGHLLTPLDAALYRSNRGCAKYLHLHGALPSSKLLADNETYRSDVIPQPIVSPATKHRIFKEFGVQTENVKKDADVQVHLQPIATERRDQNYVDGVLQNLELQRQSTLKPSRKPLVAKVYVHTKRKDRRAVRHILNQQNRRGNPESKKDDKSYKRTMIPRYANDITFPKDTISSEQGQEISSPIPVVDATTNTIPQEIENENLSRRPITSYKDTSTSPTRNQLCNCCADPYQDVASMAETCTCHQRQGSLLKLDTELATNTIDESRASSVIAHKEPNAQEEDITEAGTKHFSDEDQPSPIPPDNNIAERPAELLQVDFDDLSPLSSLRSVESNIKDSGFSDDLDRGDASSETEDTRTSPKYRFRRKPIARFVVTSGAADSVYPLDEEDDIEERGEGIAPRSASMPIIKTRESRKGSTTYSSRLLGRLTLTKEVQKTLRRYQLERRLFYELQELKRQQICGGMHEGEEPTIKRMVDRFRKHVLSPGMTDFRGPATFIAFEKYLYEQLRKLSMTCKIPTPKNHPSFSTRSYATTKHIASQGVCVCQTHMCHHVMRNRDSKSLYKSDHQESIREVVLPGIKHPNLQKSRRFADRRSKSWDRLSADPKKPSVRLVDPFNFDASKSLPSLDSRIPLPRRIPPTLLAAVAQRLDSDDVHSDDSVVVELSSEDAKSKVRHAFTVREIREAVQQWEDTAGRALKPLHLEKVLKQEDEGPVTFEVHHGKERNVFRLPTETLKGDKKWFLHYCLWPVGRYILPLPSENLLKEEMNYDQLSHSPISDSDEKTLREIKDSESRNRVPADDSFNVRCEAICLSPRTVLLLPNFRT